jgi:hypothetical protein
MRYAYNFYGWYAGPCNDSEPRSTETAPGNTSQAATPGQPRANWTGYEWLNLPYQLPPQPVIDRAALTADIDRRADALRLAIVGDPVRVEEYRLARDEAAAYIAVNYAGAVPPTVQAWATAKSWTAQQAADDIAATAQAWESALYAIRSIRLIGKEAVRGAATDAAAQTAYATALTQLSAIGG